MINMANERTKKRLQICNTCPHKELKFLAPSQCGVCGCVLKVKARIAGESCPLGKWEKTS